MIKIAFVGAGFVADYYMTTLSNYPEISLVGAWDEDANRLKQFCDFYDVYRYENMSALLADPETTIIINLTTPESHYALNKAALDAGKHVYCEKPLAMSLEDAEKIVDLAESNGLKLCAAPANALSDAFEKTASLIAADKIGSPRLVYVEMEDGPVFRADWQNWKSRSGAAWPGVHEFEIGCTIEHAGYGLSWLVGLFGPVKHISAFSALTFQDKGPGTSDLDLAPDFSVGCLTFESGLVARITCGLSGPRNRSFTTMGDRGTLVVRDLWDNRSPINLSADDERSLAQKIFSRIENKLGRTLPFRPAFGKSVRYPKTAKTTHLPNYPSKIDFARGIAMQAKAIENDETSFFSGRVALHLTELVLALSAGENSYTMQTSFEFNPNRVVDQARSQ